VTESDPDGIDHDILEALRHDGRGDVPRASRERVLQRLTVGTAVLGAATTAATGGAVAAVTTTKATLALFSTLVVGVGIGFATRSVLDTGEDPPTPPPHVASGAEARARATPLSSASPLAANPAPSPAAVNPTPDLPGGTAPSSTPTIVRTTPPSALPTPSAEPAGLAAQQALLDEARAALRRHDGENALSAVGAHRLRFPESALSEERAALEIRALAELGQMDEARKLHERFVLRFPHSLFTRSLSGIVAQRSDDSVTEPAAVPQMKSGGQAAP
jgi:hypothetical protein